MLYLLPLSLGQDIPQETDIGRGTLDFRYEILLQLLGLDRQGGQSFPLIDAINTVLPKLLLGIVGAG